MKKRIKLLLCAFALSIGGVTAVGSTQPASAMQTSCYQIENEIDALSTQQTHFQWASDDLDNSTWDHWDSSFGEDMWHVWYTDPWLDQWINTLYTYNLLYHERNRILDEISSLNIQIDNALARLDNCVW